jgi:hypothetical protein
VTGDGVGDADGQEADALFGGGMFVFWAGRVLGVGVVVVAGTGISAGWRRLKGGSVQGRLGHTMQAEGRCYGDYDCSGWNHPVM